MPSFSAILETGKGCGNVLQVGLAALFGEPKNNKQEPTPKNQGEEYLAGLVVSQNVDYFRLLRGFPDSEVFIVKVLSDVANGRCRLEKNQPWARAS